MATRENDHLLASKSLDQTGQIIGELAFPPQIPSRAAESRCTSDGALISQSLLKAAWKQDKETCSNGNTGDRLPGKHSNA